MTDKAVANHVSAVINKAKASAKTKMNETVEAGALAQAFAVANGKTNKTAPVASDGVVKSSHPVGVLKRTTQFYIDPTKIDRKEGWNPRFDFGEIEAIAASIKYQKSVGLVGGLINSIRVLKKTDGRFELVDGDRRFSAIELLMKKGETFPEGIPANLEDKDGNVLDRLIRMFTANDGKRFLPLEEAAAFKRMRDGGMTIAQIMKATGRSDNTINDCLALLESDAEVIAAVTSKKVTAGTAKKIAVYARGDKARQRELIATATAAGKDKGKRAELNKALESQQRSKHAAKGHTLKIRALGAHDLSVIGAQLAQTLKERMEVAGMAFDSDVRAWASADPELALAFTFGALEALKVAAGMPNNLVL